MSLTYNNRTKNFTKHQMRNETSNSDFKFQSELRPNLNLELLFTEHIEELRQRSFQLFVQHFSILNQLYIY